MQLYTKVITNCIDGGSVSLSNITVCGAPVGIRPVHTVIIDANFFNHIGSLFLTCSLLRIYLQCLATILVDLHLRTKADLYSFMQGSFVKIQDLIGYVSKYMLNAT